MNQFLAFLLRMLIALPTSSSVWLLSYFAFNQTFWLSGAIGFGTGALAYLITGMIQKQRFLKRHHLTRKEYKFIKKNIDDAKRKISRLHKALFSIRHIPSLKQRMELMRTTRKIYRLTKKEPKRFYKAEQFYFSHLDSAVELSEKYVFLSAQPKKTYDLDQSLYETRRTLEQLTAMVEEDLYKVISDDIDQLNFEIDVAKHTIKTKKDSQIIDESRRLK
ncbi:5-bromo-4-chloroindolyl phosphate hydrolysis family protein [Bacillus sp. DTU_2020_1000418_1_SI_GHA_SEK_038]|uniref:5-bromo-4-chloroindolyl phosphate hydrolysis family protein n=1 Tax=Bacillus sp. DTU_2020_1000418_1_SI_GHA_SEK_038 TaxID=3077585 RepID=UPI0028F01CDB|nr:5-bromo-4-chloroindolyl phosphate hydrolysis family protein [Bacillus sp. DTU_2020_1000418_1_SI_GHA_SEK_038]WNS76105.1 5-bromo-4-chloroindolyl phosphate hydrolysis family protein [Bacillus sp. DTU_2020_1000418_1_SI_GHA_SEK_038]